MTSNTRAEKKQVIIEEDKNILMLYSSDPTVNKEELWYSPTMIQDNLSRFSTSDELSDSDDDEVSFCSCLAPSSRSRRYQHTKSVLAMQAEIRSATNMTYDVTGLRVFASALSRNSLKQARARATHVARSAFDVYDSTTEWMKDTNVKDYAGFSTSRARCPRSRTTVDSAQTLTKEDSRRVVTWAL